MKAAGFIEITLPIRIYSELNRRDHWRTVRARGREQAKAVHYSLIGSKDLLTLMGTPYVVTFTHLGPRTMDDDNLASGFKKCRDAVATLLGVNDGDTSSIQFLYRQEPAKTYSARVRIEVAA